MISQSPAPEPTAAHPRQVLLFSGHMVDAPGRAIPRFPAAAEGLAAHAIEAALGAVCAGPQDLALSQAAAGGDLLFLEACQARGVHCRVLLPFDETEFIQRSVLPSADGERWRERCASALACPGTEHQVMAEVLGPLPAGADPFERANRWLLESALGADGAPVRFIVLWNGGGGDGPGGTAHMVAEVQRHGGQVTWLDTRKLFEPLLHQPSTAAAASPAAPA